MQPVRDHFAVLGVARQDCIHALHINAGSAQPLHNLQHAACDRTRAAHDLVAAISKAGETRVESAWKASRQCFAINEEPYTEHKRQFATQLRIFAAGRQRAALDRLAADDPDFASAEQNKPQSAREFAEVEQNKKDFDHFHAGIERDPAARGHEWPSRRSRAEIRRVKTRCRRARVTSGRSATSLRCARVESSGSPVRFC